MEKFSYVFTILFMLLGPIKLIPAFAGVTAGADAPFKRAVAIRAFLIASAVVAFLALSGEVLLGRYQISLDGVRIAGGLVLLLSALYVIFPKDSPQQASAGKATPIQLAVSPMVSPIIVPPAGVAAILAFVMLSPDYPGMMQAIGIALAIIMALDFLVMYFHSSIMKIPGLMMVLQVVGAILVFMQAALGVETILDGLRHLGVVAV